MSRSLSNGLVLRHAIIDRASARIPVITELSLPHVFVASSGDEYFEVSFDARPEGTDGDTPYFLLQPQFRIS